MEEILDFIRRCIKEGEVLWTYHINMRLAQRHISRKTILNSVDSFEIIESYPDDKYLPSYLIYARSGKFIFHVLIAIDKEGENIRIVTAYEPDAREWENNFRIRRKG